MDKPTQDIAAALRATAKLMDVEGGCPTLLRNAADELDRRALLQVASPGTGESEGVASAQTLPHPSGVVARLRELLAKATPGPWVCVEEYGGFSLQAPMVLGATSTAIASAGAPTTKDNGALMAAARNELTALLDWIERPESHRVLDLQYALDASEALHEWRSMDTAPKDGTEILLFQEGQRNIARWTGSAVGPCWCTPDATALYRPTAWAHLLSPPSEQAADVATGEQVRPSADATPSSAPALDAEAGSGLVEALRAAGDALDILMPGIGRVTSSAQQIKTIHDAYLKVERALAHDKAKHPTQED